MSLNSPIDPTAIGNPLSWQPTLPFLRYAVPTLLVGAFGVLVMLLTTMPEQPVRASGPLAMVLVTAISWLFLRQGKTQAAIRTLAFGSWLTITGIVILYGGVRTPALIAYPLIIMMFGWLIGPRAGHRVAALSCLMACVFAVGESWGLLPQPPTAPAGVHAAVQVLVFVITSALMAHLVRSYTGQLAERKQAEDALRIAATAFESQQGMFITDAQRVILRVNKAFSFITGYSADEAVGQNPGLLVSGRHDASFYQAMSQGLAHLGTWQGEVWNRRKSGEVYPEWLAISAVKDHSGVITNYVATFSDISEHKNAQAQIDTLAFYDPLTHLPNRRLLMDRLGQALRASEHHARKSALLFIDLDDFKTLNDTLGHLQGDALLTQVAQRLKACIREGDTVARLGSDEFVVMLEDLSENALEAATQVETVGEKILTALGQSYTLGGRAHHSSASMGVTLFGDVKSEGSEQPLKRAELAMFRAKTAGRNTLCFFDVQMQAEITAHAALEADLREAVLQQQFLLYYQPQVVGSGRVVGAEALVRWQQPQRGMVSPAEFIPLAESGGLILPIGQWVLETACTQLAAWAHDPALAHLSIAVNVSARQFKQANFVDTVLATLASTAANPMRLKLELTESMLVDDVEGMIAKMSALKAKGISFSLDDFGTGYSSLAYLKRLPLDQLKIDQGFVRNIVTDPNDAAIAKMVVALAESTGLSVIAEGVELQAQADFLAHLGCHAYQGYLFGRPVPLAAFEALAKRT
jgi:diguanylate cyclase (GGDEF)-like protein/PAS domain S-box-containing protein